MVGQATTSVLQVIICPTISKNSWTGYALLEIKLLNLDNLDFQLPGYKSIRAQWETYQAQ